MFNFSWPKPPGQSEPEPEPEAEEAGDPDGVNQWRFDRLVEAGWGEMYAAILALDHSVDLHRACELLEHGCDQAKAWEILF